MQSRSITEEQKKKLRQLFPEVFNENKIDWERLKATLGEEWNGGRERCKMRLQRNQKLRKNQLNLEK